MPHLDASALTEDRKGLEFLAEVIDVPADHPVPFWRVGETSVVVPEGDCAERIDLRTCGRGRDPVHEAA